MGTNGLDLNRVAVFLQVAEARGVSAAAARAKLPKSSVSRALSQLEDELGVQLVVRNTRQFQLTEHGQTFYEAAARGLAVVNDARDKVQHCETEPRGQLRVAAPPGFATFIVTPAIVAFTKKYPDVEIELCVTAATVDPVRDGFDVVLSLGALPDSSAKIRRLGAADAGVFASAEYLELHGTPKKPSDLAKHDCILQSRGRRKTHWRLTGASGAVDVEVHGRITADDMFSAKVAAESGGGLIVLPLHMNEVDFGTKRLTRVLPEWIIRGEPVQIVHAASKHLPLRITMFVDSILSEASSSCPKSNGELPAAARARLVG